MKKIFTLFIFSVFMGVTALAQTPMYFNTNVAGGQNSIPFASGAQMVWRRAQFCMPAGNLGAVPPNSFITAVYFQAGSSATVTYPLFYVRLKNATATGMNGVGAGPFEAGMTTVFTATNFVMTTVSGNWYQIVLQTPFLFNQTMPLIVDFEHNHTAATGPTVMQPGAIALPGSNGRQWGDWNGAPISGVGNNQLNFGIDVIPATPCTGAPPANTLIPQSFTTCPLLSNPSLSMASTYSLGGLTYSWQASTVSNVGPWTAIPNATMSTAPTGTLSQTTWYQAIVTCTNPGGGQITTSPTEYFVAAGVTKTVPYIEDFEGIQTADRWPNCSWYAPNLGSTVKTYMSSQSNNRLPRSGTKFGSYGLPSGNNMIYSNGIIMTTGITYSAALWYATEYFGYNNWSSLTLLLGSTQSPTGLVPIATVSPAISGPYKLLSGVFTVPSAGTYYIAIRATAANGSALYLSFDDFAVTIPCQDEGAVNSPTVSLATSAGTICEGDAISLTANGADDYLWSTGAIGANLAVNPMTTITYTVTGTNTLTGCTDVETQFIYVNPSPQVFAVSNKPEICPGETAALTGYNANTYAWSSGGVTNPLNVTPNATTTYSVIGTNLVGCSRTGTVTVVVKPTPTITGTSLSNNEICPGEFVSLSGSGGVSYQWLSSSSSVLYQGNPINAQIFTSTTFTVIGTGTNGCVNKNTVSQNVGTCTGLNEMNLSGKGIKVFPNPSNGQLNVQLENGEISSVKINDVSGRLVYSSEVGSSETTVDLTALSAGVYYVTISSNSGSEVVRIIKN